MAKIFSTESGNLQKVSLVTNRKLVYSDIDLSLARNTGADDDIFKKLDAAAVKQSVKNLMLSNECDKPFRPRYGANLTSILFDLVDDEDAEDDVRDRIYQVIDQFEPRANIEELEVNLSPDQNKLRVKLTFRVLNIDQTETLETTVTRYR